MCGIVGSVARAGAAGLPAIDARVRAMDALRHRGPDADGQYEHEGVWFGHLRLSILDPSCAGNQPMADRDRRLAITYNGEVYNFRDLTASLRLTGLRSGSDTEVILGAFGRLGVEAFVKLNGMFAFALHDRSAGTVFLVRDRLGIKPLYYRIDRCGLAFASEIKGLLALDGEAPRGDLTALHEWLYYGNALGGRTLYHGIQQVPPGHFLQVNLRTFETHLRQYWSLHQIASDQRSRPPAAAEAIAETRRLLESAVRRQLVSDVPVGVFLSGGVDSAAITAFASRHYDGRLATYSAGFEDDSGQDERPKARKLAALYGTDHHEMQIRRADVASLVERMVHHHDLPFADAANIPLYLMASQISSRTKVVLQGDGGDEVFGGYRRYVTLRQHRWLRPLARLVEPLAGNGAATGIAYRVRRYLRAYAAEDLGSTMALLLTLEDRRSFPETIFLPEFRTRVQAHDPFARYRECQAWFRGLDIGRQMSMVDLSIELPDIFLEKVDRATMAASLEVRVPFLDDELVEYVVRIPGTLRMRGGRKKWLLKQALTGIVPDEILNGPKTGFNVPFGAWLRTALEPLFFDHLTTFTARQPGVLDAALLRRWFDAAKQGRAEHDYMLWKVLNLLVWSNNGRIELAA
jgi:asparagine synthase (glutamine-hydrolysing)